MVRQSFMACSAGLILAVAACDQSTAPSAGISQATANQLAADMDAVSSLGSSDFGFGTSFSVGIDGSGVVATVIPINNHIVVTRQCPKGGEAKFDGTITGTGDRTTHSLTLHTVATRTDTNCAFDTRDGVLTLNGHIDYVGDLNIVNGALSGLQTQSHEGSFSWSRPGASGTCDVKIASSYDPATHTVTVKGDVCGRHVDVTRTRGS
jgi:hypothetical protein